MYFEGKEASKINTLLKSITLKKKKASLLELCLYSRKLISVLERGEKESKSQNKKAFCRSQFKELNGKIRSGSPCCHAALSYNGHI